MNPAEERTLLDLFAVCNDVFTETDIFAPDKLNIGLGRIYRAWRRTRDVLAHQSYTPLRPRIPDERSEERESNNHRET